MEGYIRGLSEFRPRSSMSGLGVGLAALPPLLYVYMPRPPIGGAQFLVFPAMATVLSLFILWLGMIARQIDVRVIAVLFLLLAVNIGAGASFLANASELRPEAVVELFRPALFAVFLLFGYFVASAFGPVAVKRGLLVSAHLILLGQLVIAMTQLMGLPVFDLVYSAEKSRPFWSLLRASGSLGNPNIFGWVVAQAAVTIYLLRHRSRRLWLLLGAMLVLTSGSRTLLLVFPLMPLAVSMWAGKQSWAQYTKIIVVGGLALVAFISLIFVFASFLPYLAQLRGVLLGGSLQSVSSFAARLDMWGDAYAAVVRGGAEAWAIGLGSREIIQVLDNDFLFVLFRLGIVGLILHLSLLGYTLLVFTRAKRHPVAILGMQYLTFSLVLGLVYDTLGGWNFPLMLFFLLGLTIGITRHVRQQETLLPVPSRQSSLLVSA